MDLQTLKNTYAQEQGYEDWLELTLGNDCAWDIEFHWEQICLLAQKAALENAADNAVTITEEHYVAGHIGLTVDRVIIDRSSITNEQNLIL